MSKQPHGDSAVQSVQSSAGLGECRLTEADKYALRVLPKGDWFTVQCVRPVLTRRPRYRINRLVAAGLVKKERAGNSYEYFIPNPL